MDSHASLGMTLFFYDAWNHNTLKVLCHCEQTQFAWQSITVVHGANIKKHRQMPVFLYSGRMTKPINYCATPNTARRRPESPRTPLAQSAAQPYAQPLVALASP